MSIPGSVVQAQTPYEHDDTAEELVASVENFDENELLDGGCECALCHAVILPGQFVRRTASGEWEHEACPRVRRRRRPGRASEAGRTVG